jgi:hypothetical protein
MTPALDRVCRSTKTTEPPIEAHPEHVERNDPNPSPHGIDGTSREESVVSNEHAAPETNGVTAEF